MVKQNRALAQRVFFSHILQHLTQSETSDYIAHRLKVAGTEGPIFSVAAVQEVFRLSGGNPRLINILCDQALLSGYALDKKKIGDELIKESTENTLIPLNTQKEPAAAAQKEDPAKQSTSTELTAETTTGPSRITPAKTDIRTPGRKTAYWAPIALTVVLGLAAYFYLNDGFRTAFTSSQTDPGQSQRSGQPAEPAPASEIGRLQGQMLELRRQKDDTETRLRELQTRFGALEKDQQELKATKTRVAEFESAVASKDKDLTAAGQKLAELEKALVQEKGSKDRLNADVSSKDAAIAELQKKLESSASNQASLKGEADTFKKENTRLQAQLVEINNQKDAAEAQLQEVRAQKPAPPPAPAPVRAPATSQPPPVPSDTAGAAPDPAGAIDFVLKKKSQ
jgi:predicted  nucleic acid-binding Zn-ribbon protein